MITTRYGQRGFVKSVDWLIIICYVLLVAIGWVNIYSAAHSEAVSILDFNSFSGKQFIWIGTAIVLALLVLFVIPTGTYEAVSIPSYVLMLGLLFVVRFIAEDTKGSYSWLELGPLSFQPAEFSKFTTSLLLAALLGKYNFKLDKFKNVLISAALVALPMGAIIFEHETGSALVYLGFVFMLYREGLTGWIIFFIFMVIVLFISTLVWSPYTALLMALTVVTLCCCISSSKPFRWFAIYLPVLVLLAVFPLALDDIVLKYPLSSAARIKPIYVLSAFSVIYCIILGIQSYMEKSGFKLLALLAFLAGMGMIFSVEPVFYNVLEDYQRLRIEVLLGMTKDPMGIGYNVHQSQIAIGSGGLFGKGFLKGTQTAYGFVPEQHTDFIFCTVGEEWGFVGCLVVIALFVILIWRILLDAERSREGFTRIYGYCVAGILFMHLFINVGMTIGIMPIIGIPLPFVSYGGSSMWGFTILLFVFVALDRNEKKYF